MKHLFSFSLIIILMISISCTREDSLIIDADALVSDALNDQDLATSNARMAGVSSNVYSIAGGTEVGTAYLNKNNKGFTVNLMTTGLTPGYTYTLWAVVFNIPGNCVDGCNGPDLGDAEGEVMYIAGHVAGNNGKGNFSGHLNEGDDSGSINDIFSLPANGGLRDVDVAEIHFVVRCHGPKIPGEVDDQINSFNGGCHTGLCEDIQFAAFPAGC